MRGVRRLLILSLVAFILVGLLLGAVARIRIAAAMHMCRNNNRMWVIALDNYYGTYNAFPAAVLLTDALPPEKRLSWLFELDPFVHARMDPEWTRFRTEPWDSPDNLRLGRRGMRWVSCPARGSEVGEDGLTVTNYVGAAGVGADAVALPTDDPRAGLFGYDRKRNRDDIKDGASTTIALVETTRTGPWIAGGWPSARGLDTAAPPYSGDGRQFGGAHPGGTLVGFADGSCRFIRDGVSPVVWEALFTIAGGDDPGSLPGE